VLRFEIYTATNGYALPEVCLILTVLWISDLGGVFALLDAILVRNVIVIHGNSRRNRFYKEQRS